MKNIKTLTGMRIRTLRKKLQISQEELSLKCGLDRTYISGVERGIRNISIVNLCKIVSALETDLSEFFNDNVFKINEEIMKKNKELL